VKGSGVVAPSRGERDTQALMEGTDCQILVLFLRGGLIRMAPENGIWQACLATYTSTIINPAVN
jgi:hypothetical protein